MHFILNESIDKLNQFRGIYQCGYYREWSIKGQKNNQTQLEAIKVLTSQIERADSENSSIIILGDANLCSEKWEEEGL